MYDEAPENDKIWRPYYSSCMTDEVGPERWRFEHCEMKELNTDGSCEKTKRPRDVTESKEICEKALTEVTRIIEETLIGSLVLVDKILISSEDPNEPELTCYNERNFREKGWCRVMDYKTRRHLGKIEYRKQWGFCSPSCKNDKWKGNFPKIYREMEWTVDTRSQNPCTDRDDWKLKEYGVCMKGTLPGAKVGRFQRIKGELEFIG